MLKPYRKRFYSEKFGKEIDYFFSMKRGHRSGSNFSWGRQDGDKFVYTQSMPFLLIIPFIFLCLFIGAAIGKFFMIIGVPEEVGNYIALGFTILFVGILFIWGIPRFIHFKFIRNHLDNLKP